jgi:hypothetical protein
MLRTPGRGSAFDQPWMPLNRDDAHYGAAFSQFEFIVAIGYPAMRRHCRVLPAESVDCIIEGIDDRIR